MLGRILRGRIWGSDRLQGGDGVCGGSHEVIEDLVKSQEDTLETCNTCY